MFELDWGKLVIIGVVALIVIGPKELPGVLRTIGQWMGKVRRMASEFQGQFQEAMREAEMADLKKQVDDISAAASGVGNFDPLASAHKELESAMTDTPATPSPSTAASSPSVEAPAAEPAPEVAIPATEPAPPVSEKDFAAPEPVPPKEGGERAA
ncbi:MAG TPA: Sec-independent protein translocase protein TatB [Pseudolabrys sp.]|nr:Sec-independent protein translocase protein TatB [Pseudolabrys sp.]